MLTRDKKNMYVAFSDCKATIRRRAHPHRPPTGRPTAHIAYKDPTDHAASYPGRLKKEPWIALDSEGKTWSQGVV